MGTIRRVSAEKGAQKTIMKQDVNELMDQHLDTLCLQAGYQPGNGEPWQIPIVQSTTFRYATGEDMGKLFDLEASGYFYTRLQNPTSDSVAAKICALEGGTAAMLTSSGQAASFLAAFNLLSCGDHAISSTAIYGGTYNLFAVTMKRMGIEFTFVEPDCSEEELEAAFRPNTKLVFGETISNPSLRVLDFDKFSRQDRPRQRRSPDRRQHLRHTGELPTLRARRGYRDAFYDQVHGRACVCGWRCDRRQRKV